MAKICFLVPRVIHPERGEGKSACVEGEIDSCEGSEVEGDAFSIF